MAVQRGRRRALSRRASTRLLPEGDKPGHCDSGRDDTSCDDTRHMSVTPDRYVAHMPSSVTALVIVMTFVAPGLLFEEGIARVLSFWRVEDLSRRVLRFVAWSLVLHILVFPVTYRIWFDWIRLKGLGDGLPSFVERYGTLKLWFLLVVAILLPFLLGVGAGQLAIRQVRILKYILGASLEPTAWEWMTYQQEPAVVRIQLKGGSWVAGYWTYAGVAPETPDIALQQVGVDSDGILSMENDAPILTGCLLYTSPSPRDRQKSRMPSSA